MVVRHGAVMPPFTHEDRRTRFEIERKIANATGPMTMAPGHVRANPTPGRPGSADPADDATSPQTSLRSAPTGKR